MYTTKPNFSTSSANRRFSPVKMLKLQFGVLSPFSPLSSEEDTDITSH
jgi:hypothetical protein